MKRVILDYGNGSVGILVPAPQRRVVIGQDSETLEPITELQGLTVEEIAEKDRAGFPYEIVDVSEVPTNRAFRGAWAPAPGGLVVDMPRARVIQMDRIRGRRDERLRELDIEQLRGEDVAQRKQTLRDLPANVDLESVQTPEELEAVWPAGLEE